MKSIKTPSVTLSIEEYTELVNFKKEIEKGSIGYYKEEWVRYSTGGGNQYAPILRKYVWSSGWEMVKTLIEKYRNASERASNAKAEASDYFEKFYSEQKDREELLAYFKAISSREFRKWKKENK